MLISNLVFSQARLGYTISEIKNDYKYNIFEKKYTDEGQIYYTSFFKHGVMGYFMTDGICTTCMLIPTLYSDIIYLKEQYDEQYIKVGNYYWKSLYRDGVMIIKLIEYNGLYVYTYEMQ